VSLVIRPGDLVAVVGPSGSGKSTLLQLLGLLDRASEGTMAVDGRDVGELDDRALTRLRLETIGFVFQRFHLLMGQTAIENVALPLEAAGRSVGERYARAASLLKLVGLADRMFSAPSQLSGGQRQRVAIARALANDAQLILADEPTGALHSGDKTGVVALLRAMHASGKTVVVVTHDEQIAAICDRRLDIRDGLVTEATVRGRAA
jgi:macrolide transport system ATP-binding/permease protein